MEVAHTSDLNSIMSYSPSPSDNHVTWSWFRFVLFLGLVVLLANPTCAFSIHEEAHDAKDMLVNGAVGAEAHLLKITSEFHAATKSAFEKASAAMSDLETQTLKKMRTTGEHIKDQATGGVKAAEAVVGEKASSVKKAVVDESAKVVSFRI